jgi:hypothetical protein
MPRPGPEERFSPYPLGGEDVLRKLLGAEEGDGAEPASDEPADEAAE